MIFVINRLSDYWHHDDIGNAPKPVESAYKEQFILYEPIREYDYDGEWIQTDKIVDRWCVNIVDLMNLIYLMEDHQEIILTYSKEVQNAMIQIYDDCRYEDI